MYVKAVKYRDTWLAPGSDALRLYEERKFKELDAHLKACETRARALGGSDFINGDK